ncbi:MAG: hypothetical protein CM1200mP28_02400 [Deltaproteobacteria bacterium]|nr:MAG: hypothetical protein CM1200mP28_02400 [Deltaproteobacteria bacterium]
MLERESGSKKLLPPEEESLEEPSQMKGQYYSETRYFLRILWDLPIWLKTAIQGNCLILSIPFFSGFDRIIAKHNVER